MSNSDIPTAADVPGLAPGALAALKTRCDNYAQNCAAKGQQQEPRFAQLCATVSAEVLRRAKRSRSPVEAFRRWSRVRQKALDAGYAPPVIEGTPSASEIDAACEMLDGVLLSSTTSADLEQYVAELNARTGRAAAMCKR